MIPNLMRLCEKVLLNREVSVFVLFLIRVQLFYNVVLLLLYNNLNQLCGYIYPLPFEPPSHHSSEKFGSIMFLFISKD